MLRTRYFFTCIFLCVILSTSRITASDNYSDAFRIYNEKKFYAASIEFERAIFYETDINKIAYLKYHKSLCYKELGNFTGSLEELNKINLFNLPDSMFYMIRYQQALNNYLNNDPDQSLWNIGEIRFRFPGSARMIELIPLNILCLNAVRKWDEAYKLFSYFLENSGIDNSLMVNYKGKVDYLYKKRNIPRYHSPKKAENLSRFIPGSGQMCTGAVGEGSVNFLLNASLLGFALYEFYTEYYVTGYFVGLGLFNKTYHGGMRRAGLIAEQKNKDDINNFNLETSSLIMKIIESENIKMTPMKNVYILK